MKEHFKKYGKYYLTRAMLLGFLVLIITVYSDTVFVGWTKSDIAGYWIGAMLISAFIIYIGRTVVDEEGSA